MFKSSRIANAAGIPGTLHQHPIGFTTRPVEEGITLTMDGYWVKVKDRVVLSGQFDAFDSSLDPALTGELQSLQVAYAQFFANAVSTTNRGVDKRGPLFCFKARHEGFSNRF